MSRGWDPAFRGPPMHWRAEGARAVACKARGPWPFTFIPQLVTCPRCTEAVVLVGRSLSLMFPYGQAASWRP